MISDLELKALYASLDEIRKADPAAVAVADELQALVEQPIQRAEIARRAQPILARLQRSEIMGAKEPRPGAELVDLIRERVRHGEYARFADQMPIPTIERSDGSIANWKADRWADEHGSFGNPQFRGAVETAVGWVMQRFDCSEW